jgi:aryl-alcohol dehydrogenase-like predicted oxidoreductase
MPALALGTVQLGLNYGIANNEGKTSTDEAARILELAENIGIRFIDTAAMYGDSETVIGEHCPTGSTFHHVTKTLALHGENVTSENLAFVRQGFESSLLNLRQQSVYGLLVHHCRDLLAPNGKLLFDLLQELKASGKVEKVGVSAYNDEELQAVIDRYPIDIVQIPLSVFDQRLKQSGTLSKLKDRGIKIHVRSIFLQGLLLLGIDELPAYFLPIRDHISRYHKWLGDKDLTRLEGAMLFAQQQIEIDQIVTGVCDCVQLSEIDNAFTRAATLPKFDFSPFAMTSEHFLNPSKWPKS